jgi:hypothetical protein
MSDRDDDNANLITNQDTLARRAWIERAMQSVRRRLKLDSEAAPEQDPPGKPRLHVVPSGKR